MDAMCAISRYGSSSSKDVHAALEAARAYDEINRHEIVQHILSHRPVVREKNV
ncbi:hypothetical protein EXIGLDRAFT_724576 [Exidia glandulosa HHB12029]|uniref:Uncharacterized protein n=1 Tax=Exidia glandulosa HHB12029 TaxID=1314781 RepID=A0A165MNX5_EXIGL|nr:hypothetical protein EXIGLDRAFT_724576 [Exidia glandulosa HHB12029]